MYFDAEVRGIVDILDLANVNIACVAGSKSFDVFFVLFYFFFFFFHIFFSVIN